MGKFVRRFFFERFIKMKSRVSESRTALWEGEIFSPDPIGGNAKKDAS